MTDDTHNHDTDDHAHPIGQLGGDTAPSLPDDLRSFWSAAVDIDELELPRRRESTPTLERLVPSPFPRSGFPLIGFLATVYDHVADFARKRNDTPDP